MRGARRLAAMRMTHGAYGWDRKPHGGHAALKGVREGLRGRWRASGSIGGSCAYGSVVLLLLLLR